MDEFDLARFDAVNFTGISDQEVFHKALPPYGFVRRWMEYMYKVTDGPLAYHLGVGLTAVATLTPPDVHLPDGDELKANMFVMLVGPPSHSRKTFAVKHAREQIENAGGSAYILGDHGSGEGFLDEVLAFPRRCIVSEEGMVFLQHTIGGSYGANIRASLMGLFDNSPVVRHTVGQQQKKKETGRDQREKNPRVNMMMACTKAHLEDFTFRSDWEGGFLSRYAILWARRQRHFGEAQLDVSGRHVMIAHLKALLTVASGGQCQGMLPDAKAYYRAWQSRLDAQASMQNEKVIGVVDRAQQHARKASLVLAYDRHVSEAGGYTPETLETPRLEAPWYVGIEDVRVGCALAEFSIYSALHIERNITDNEHGQIMNRIVNFIRLDERVGCRTYAEILREVNRPLKTVQHYLDTLVQSHRLVQCFATDPKRGSVQCYAIPDAPWFDNGGGYIPVNRDSQLARH